MIAILILFLSFVPTSSDFSSGDAAFMGIDYPIAITVYEDQLQSHPNDPEVLWRLARVYVCSGEVKDPPESEAFFKKAEMYARRSILLDSTKSESHTWLAAALGYLALNAGLKDQVRLTNELQLALDKALALNPNNDAAYSIRGSFYRALGNVSWFHRQLASLFLGHLPEGDFEDGERALKRAISLAPGVMRHHYELGVLYRDWGKRMEAKKSLEVAASLPIRVAIDKPRLAKIKELLALLSDLQ